jgi:hypothetical protein
MSVAANFNETYYLTNNADVVVAISQGQFTSALDHFNKFGGKELRAPNATFNPSYYAINNSDVLNAVSSGTYSNVFAHYQDFGETENRAPSADFANFTASAYLTANTDVAAAVTAGTIASALEHFIAFGQNESRQGSGITSAVATGSTFTLTSGADTGSTFVGTDQGDTFNATLTNEGGVANVLTLNPLDAIDGGDGTDTLNATINASVTPTSLANIENMVLTAVADNSAGADAAADVIGMANAGGITSITFASTGDDDGVTASGVQNALTGAQGLTIKNSAVATTVTTVNTAFSGDADSLVINLESVTAGALIVDPTGTGTNGYETFTINSNGTAANTLASFDDGNSTSGATLNIAGAQGLTITAALAAQFTTINAANATGAVSARLDNAAIHTVTGGTGNDTFDLSGAFVDGTTPASDDTVNGGDGTDVLVLDDAEVTAVGSAAQFASVTNIETVRMNSEITADATFANLTGVTTVEFDGNGIAGNVRATGLTYTVASGQEMQFDLADTGNESMSFTVAGSATTDSMAMDINGVDIGGGAVILTGIETLNIATSGTAVMDGAMALVDTAATQAINISGTGSLNLGAITADAVTSTMTGAGTLTLGTLAAATAFTGGATIDVVTGSTAADILAGGAAADTITNTASGADDSAGDIITGGDGFDTIGLVGDSASATTYAGSSQITDFTVGSASTNTDLIRFSDANTDYGDDQGVAGGLADVGAADGAAGAVVIQTIAQSSGATAGGANANVFKLTTGVAFNTNLQTTFNDAIGTSTLTGLNGESQVAVLLHDTTNNVMVIANVDANAGITSALETADVARLIGTVNMTAADYAIIDADNFANFF